MGMEKSIYNNAFCLFPAQWGDFSANASLWFTYTVGHAHHVSVFDVSKSN